MSPLAKFRLSYEPPLPPLLRNLKDLVSTEDVELPVQPNILSQFDQLKRKKIVFKKGSFSCPPLKVGVVLSGGQASGGHNVIVGLYRALKSLNANSSLIGFLNGPGGIVDNKTKLLDEAYVNSFLNQGGFDMIGSGRTKIETDEQFEKAFKSLEGFDGLVVIGGDDSNTNAALLAQYFLKRNKAITIVGVPKTIDGDLANEYIETSFGFDTAVKVYSESIGNIQKDALSAKKYWYFIKLMGRSASHITLECAYQTHPNLTLISEERRSLDSIVNEMVDLIETRAKAGKNYGTILIPEGIIEFIPEIESLIKALNRTQDPNELPDDLKKFFFSLPDSIQKQLSMDRDPHGNVEVSKIDTERFFIELVKAKCKTPFTPQPIFLGYEGRSAFPSNFDAKYTYALGHLAALLVAHKATGTIASISHLKESVDKWEIAGIPLISMMDMEERKGKMKPVIAKKLVDLNGKLYKHFKAEEKKWDNDDYVSPGPIQFSGPAEITDVTTFTLGY
jgi:pyrophosphate--fructose-6-phosphate 1-phosphotransferase